MLSISDFVSIKEQLYQQCILFVENRIDSVENTMKAAQDAANNETKSSAGDKYETTRSMMQLDNVMNSRQLAEAIKLKSELQKIDVTRSFEVVQVGCLVQTNQATYFVAIGAGKLTVGGLDYFAISAQSPIGMELMHKKVGDSVSFNKQIMKILAIQ